MKSISRTDLYAALKTIVEESDSSGTYRKISGPFCMGNPAYWAGALEDLIHYGLGPVIRGIDEQNRVALDFAKLSREREVWQDWLPQGVVLHKHGHTTYVPIKWTSETVRLGAVDDRDAKLIAYGAHDAIEKIITAILIRLADHYGRRVIRRPVKATA